MQCPLQARAVVGVEFPDPADDVIDDLGGNFVLVEDRFHVQIARGGNPAEVEDDLLQGIPAAVLTQRRADPFGQDAQHYVEVIGDSPLRSHMRSS